MHSTRRKIHRFALAACALAFGGCAGDGVGLDQNGRPLVPGGTTGGALTPDFVSIQDHVFTPICSAACHAGAAAPQGLRLDASNSYALLVGVPSTEVPTILRVNPANPDSSYIIQKLEGHAAVGARMPLGGPYLDAATVAVIRQWITDGALRNPAVAAAASFATTAVVPATGDALTQAPARIVVEFSAELDETRIDGSSLRLERLAADAGGAVQGVPITLDVPRGDPRVLLVTPRAALGDGRYQLVVAEPPDTGLASVGGQRLRDALAVTTFEVAAQP